MTNWLSKYTEGPAPAIPGASGYFSKPSLILDPQLFDGETLKEDVRQSINDLFFSYMRSQYRDPERWCTLWLAGSGISYQWAADRGNGDLDVLFGVNYNGFLNFNPEYGVFDRDTIAWEMNEDLRKNLWPRTALTTFHLGDNPYEVTFFLNPGVEDGADSITNIHPYAAYNLTSNSWTVKPPKLPDDPASMYPVEFEQQAVANREAAQALETRYNALIAQMDSSMPNTPTWHNARAGVVSIVQQAESLFDQIHLGRKNAFSNQGKGYSDFYNYQWQAGKRDGIVQTLNNIAQRGKNIKAAEDTALYGMPVESDTRILLSRAIQGRGI